MHFKKLCRGRYKALNGFIIKEKLLIVQVFNTQKIRKTAARKMRRKQEKEINKDKRQK